MPMTEFLTSVRQQPSPSNSASVGSPKLSSTVIVAFRAVIVPIHLNLDTFLAWAADIRKNHQGRPIAISLHYRTSDKSATVSGHACIAGISKSFEKSQNRQRVTSRLPQPGAVHPNKNGFLPAV
jgi:hypothetical protein